ncbi:glycine cleavage system protein GcvH [bacterium]|nr:glycine cleavage system protein GcvH [bacterium]
MVPKDLLYTEKHEWARVEKGVATIGITKFAQDELGDVVFVEFGAIGDEVTQFEPVGTIEAVKAVSDMFAPVSGKIAEVNGNLEQTPDAVNKSPYGDGWIAKIEMSNEDELKNLLTPEQYEKHIGE